MAAAPAASAAGPMSSPRSCAEYAAQIGHKPAPSEVASWQSGLMALSMLVDQAEPNDQTTRRPATRVRSRARLPFRARPTPSSV